MVIAAILDFVKNMNDESVSFDVSFSLYASNSVSRHAL